MAFPEFDPGKKKVLFFSRGRGRGHAIPDIEIVKELYKLRDDIEVRFVSYGTGARTIEEFDFPLIDLDLPEDNSVNATMISAAKLIGWLDPDLVVAHEEFPAMPASKILDKPTVFVTDWFTAPDSYAMDALRYADRVVFIDEPGIYDEPPWLDGRVTYVGPILRPFEYARQDRDRARRELGVPSQATVITVLPGSWTEARVPAADLILEAFGRIRAPEKRLIWLAGADCRLIQEKAREDEEVIVKTQDWKIDRLMVASDVAVAKSNRKTLIELAALGVPAVSISHGSNPFDEKRARSLPNCRVVGVDESAVELCRALEDQIQSKFQPSFANPDGGRRQAAANLVKSL